MIKLARSFHIVFGGVYLNHTSKQKGLAYLGNVQGVSNSGEIIWRNVYEVKISSEK